MVNYIIRRLLLVPVLLFGVTVLIFGMLQFLSPVERSALYVRDIPKNERALEGVIRQYGLDKPVYVQYWRWLVGTRNSVVDPLHESREPLFCEPKWLQIPLFSLMRYPKPV